jgi:acid phosphatase family membrane protein YuiD
MYIYILCPIIAFVLAQGTKVFLRSLHHKIGWHDITAYSNMPSGHTATVTSLVVITALKLGLTSPIFAVSVVLASIVITDAVGLRNYLGEHGKTLNILVKDLKEDEFLDRSYTKQIEKIGHTPLQVIIGAVVGALVSIVAYLLF